LLRSSPTGALHLVGQFGEVRVRGRGVGEGEEAILSLHDVRGKVSGENKQPRFLMGLIYDTSVLTHVRVRGS